MSTPFPAGIDPFTFADTLPIGSTNTSAASILAQQQQGITTTMSAAGTMYLTFVVFDYPNANNAGAGGAPQVPIVEVLTQPLSAGANPWQQLGQTAIAGENFIDLQSPGQVVDYTYQPLAGNGLFQIVFTQNAVSFDGQDWTIRFTINDGITSATSQVGVTFNLDPANTQSSWIAVPGQLSLPPAAIDFGAAFASLTLSGPALPAGAKQLIAGKTYPLSLPVGNYGTAPLVVSSVTPPGTTNGFSIPAPAQPLTIAPGCVDNATLQVNFAAPASGQTGTPASAASFTLVSNDTGTGQWAHANTASFYATAGNQEIVLVLDLSGSMATEDDKASTRWYLLQQAVGQVMNSLVNLAGPADSFGAVVYPSSNGNSVGQIVTVGQTVLKQVPIDTAHATTLAGALAGYAPTDSTPMAGTAASPGGIYTAAGLPSNPATDCGLFLPSVNPAFARNYRWMVLMSDGMSNVGDDPIAIPAAYFHSRNIQALSIGYGTATGGQVNPATLKAVAANSAQNAGASNYFPADIGTGHPSQDIIMAFEKTAAAALGLSFAIDPDATLVAGVKENQHQVVITQYDKRASFVGCVSTVADSVNFAFTLITPLGEIIDQHTAKALGIAFAFTDLSQAYYVGTDVLENTNGTPRYGTWNIVASRPVRAQPPPSVVGAIGSFADDSDAAVTYAYHVGIDSDLTLFVGSGGNENIAGDPIEVAAAVSLHGRPFPNAEVKAQIMGSGQGFVNWLAAQTVTAAEYTEALRSLGGLHDVQALFVKTTALSLKGIVFPGAGSNLTQQMKYHAKTGTYRNSFPNTTQPGTYQFLISATGQDDKGNAYTRQQSLTTVVTVQPDAAATDWSITYQVVSNQMNATLWIAPKDRLGNVFLVDPAITSAIDVLLADGAVASGPLKWNLDDSYSQLFTYPLTATPTIGISVGGVAIVPKVQPPDFGKLLFVNEVVKFVKGREAKAGANLHADPTKALGDPSRKPLTEFVSLGGLGMAAFDVKGQAIKAREISVFVALDKSLRAYAVDVLPVQAGIGWLEIGRSRGITQTFDLVPKPFLPPDTLGWLIDVSGVIAHENFDITIPLNGKLRPPSDPLRRIGAKGIAAVRVRDVSNRLVDPGGAPSASPGVSILGIGFAT